jgi:c-di-GMP-binding flagellar brake protein YcgR
MQENAAENRRKEARFSVSDSVYVIINTEPQTLGQMVEISTSGLAFTFVDLNGASKRLSEQVTLRMDLFAGGKGFFIKDLACRLVSKIENVSDQSRSSLTIKRVGVQFENLTLPQQVQVNHLVKRQDELAH